MKKVMLMLSFLGIFVLSCDKNDMPVNEISDSNLKMIADEDMNASFIEGVIQLADLYTAFDDMFFLKSAEAEACPKITREATKEKIYPVTIVMDFGTGCTAGDGKNKSGKMIVVKSAPWNQKGATRKISFENFAVDGVKIEGSQVATHESISDDKQTISWQGEVKMTKADNSWVSRTENITGYKTPALDDNILEVSGATDVKRSDNTAWSRKITTPLVRIGTCKHFTEGVAQIEKTGAEKHTIDYGFSKGTGCDKWVLITRGTTKKEVELK